MTIEHNKKSDSDCLKHPKLNRLIDPFPEKGQDKEAHRERRCKYNGGHIGAS